MRVLLKMTLDCEPETVWAKLHDPAVFARVMWPLVRVRSLEPGGFPERWEHAEHRIALTMFGLMPMGVQSVRLSAREGEATGINILRDTGVAESGLLTLLRNWDHRMAISELPDGRTLYRDQLRVRAGFLTPLAWPGLWLFWQWRGMAMKRLSADW
ncbi:MAG: hypothetical protein ACKOXM_07185 [Agromyces sp.]